MMNKLIELLKSLNIGSSIQKILGASLFTIIGAVGTWSFTDRDKSLTEMSAYDKYLTDVIVLNDNPVKKRMLAQYFANVTPSFWQQRNWQSYYEEVCKDYAIFIRKDSIDKVKFSALATEQKEKIKLSDSQQVEYEELKRKLAINNSYFNAPIQLPDNQYSTIANSSYTIYIQSSESSFKKSEKIRNTLLNNGFNIPAIEKKINIISDDIRYFFDGDAQKVVEITELLKDENIKFDLKNFKRLNSTVKSNIIEIWIK